MTGPPSPREADEVLAAELAFGLLGPEDRAAAEARLAGDADLSALRDRWQERAAMLATGDVTPGPEIWKRIAAQLPANQNDADIGGLTSRLRFWRVTAAGALAAASVLAVILAERPSRPIIAPRVANQVAPMLVAMLGPDRGRAVAVTFNPRDGRVLVSPSGINLLDHSAELWVIPHGGKPRSLGTFATSGPVTRPAPIGTEGLIRPGATLAVSVEPRGGSPTGQPTGPVILTGLVAKA